MRFEMETRLWCILWCHWAHVCSGLPWDKAQKKVTSHSPHLLLSITQFPDAYGIIIMPLDPIDTSQLSQDDIMLLFSLKHTLEIHEKPPSRMWFWLWERGEKTEIPQNNKVVLCDPPLITEVWLVFSFSSLHHWVWRPMGRSASHSHSQPLLSGEPRRQTAKHVKWAEITIIWLTDTDAVVSELEYVWWETDRNLLTSLFRYLQGIESHKRVNHVLSVCTSLELLCLLPCCVGEVSWAKKPQEPNCPDCPASSTSPLSGVFHYDVWSVSSVLNCIH